MCRRSILQAEPEIRALVERGARVKDIARLTGISPRSLRHYWRSFSDTPPPGGPMRTAAGIMAVDVLHASAFLHIADRAIRPRERAITAQGLIQVYDLYAQSLRRERVERGKRGLSISDCYQLLTAFRAGAIRRHACACWSTAFYRLVQPEEDRAACPYRWHTRHLAECTRAMPSATTAARDLV
jgi:AcrR family transcriptional regulator